MENRWNPSKIIHVDREGDRERASDDYSRFGSYVGARELDFRDRFSGDGPLAPALSPMDFAQAAWLIACPPIMSPGLVEWRPDLASVELEKNFDGDQLTVVVKMPLRHDGLAAKIPRSYDDWERYDFWNNGGYERLTRPDTKPGSPLVMASLEIRHIPTWNLLQPTATTGLELVEEALASVEATAAAINAELPEIIRTVLGEK